jgi:hypothetical protein
MAGRASCRRIVRHFYLRCFARKRSSFQPLASGFQNALRFLFTFMNSNRVTYEKLEMHLTHTKQTPGLVSNRGNCRSSCPNLHFRTPLVTHRFRATLLRISSHGKMLFFKHRRLVALAKQSYIARSHRLKFLIASRNASRESSSIRKHNTYDFLIGTEIRFFHGSQAARHWSLGTLLACPVAKGHRLRLIGTELRFFQFHDSAPFIRCGLRVC